MFPDGARTITVTDRRRPVHEQRCYRNHHAGGDRFNMVQPSATCMTRMRELRTLVKTYAPVIQSPDGIAEIVIGEATTTAVAPSPNSRPISKIGRNAGTVLVTVTVSEEPATNGPTESTSHRVNVMAERLADPTLCRISKPPGDFPGGSFFVRPA